MLGPSTVLASNWSESQGRSQSWGASVSYGTSASGSASVSAHARPLLTAQEVRQLSAHATLLLAAGGGPGARP
jgi:type IV secretory pathway TraG/TraD family ATPase VirD4